MTITKLFLLTLFTLSSCAQNKQISKLYTTNNINGSLLIESLDGKQIAHHNLNNNAYVPASTFKIPNTLIILEEGLITDLSEVIKWDGVEREFDIWNRDHDLVSAFQYSCVWCYQRYARIIGDEKYHQYLQKFDYGNQLTGVQVDTFWLIGDLKMSLKDQIEILRKVHAEDLPVKTQHIKTLKKIMLTENNEEYKIYSKTGWSGKHTWYVGYVEVDNDIWLFANYIEMKNNSELKFRKQIVMDAFKILKVIP